MTIEVICILEKDPIQVGKRIRFIRTNNLGLSMDDFGKRIDNKVKSGTVSNWETGKNLPNNKRLAKIAELGKITVYELLYGEKEEIVSFESGEDFIKARQKLIEEIESNNLEKIINKSEFERLISLGENKLISLYSQGKIDEIENLIIDDNNMFSAHNELEDKFENNIEKFYFIMSFLNDDLIQEICKFMLLNTEQRKIMYDLLNNFSK